MNSMLKLEKDILYLLTPKETNYSLYCIILSQYLHVLVPEKETLYENAV